MKMESQTLLFRVWPLNFHSYVYKSLCIPLFFFFSLTQVMENGRKLLKRGKCSSKISVRDGVDQVGNKNRGRTVYLCRLISLANIYLVGVVKEIDF